MNIQGYEDFEMDSAGVHRRRMSQPKLLPPKQTEKHQQLSKEYFDMIMERAVKPTISFFEQMFAEQQLKLPLQIQYKEEKEGCYLDDGNTQCPGSKYKMLVIAPIMRDFCDEWQEHHGYWHGTNTSCLAFAAEITLRDHDSKGGRNDSVSFYAFPYYHNEGSKSHNRITYGNHGGLTLHQTELLQTYKVIKQVIEDHATAAKMNGILAQMGMENFRGMYSITTHRPK